jgi:hypothetical protein
VRIDDLRRRSAILSLTARSAGSGSQACQGCASQQPARPASDRTTWQSVVRV